jgi:hypothetical protein
VKWGCQIGGRVASVRVFSSDQAKVPIQKLGIKFPPLLNNGNDQSAPSLSGVAMGLHSLPKPYLPQNQGTPSPSCPGISFPYPPLPGMKGQAGFLLLKVAAGKAQKAKLTKQQFILVISGSLFPSLKMMGPGTGLSLIYTISHWQPKPDSDLQVPVSSPGSWQGRVSSLWATCVAGSPHS